ncbi:hypothetical protein [Salegentibacter sediminis]|uniref:hypothetical protein n=1 Tax=Salegentibacter sediminis TaxID=1930251 RepID=UPI0012FF7354|nr:hypothetical protein [Salegentibacter sediminis]
MKQEWVDSLSLFPFYNHIEIPATISELVSDFCNSHQSNISQQKLLSLIGGAQNAFIGSQPLETDSDPVVKDFENERVELEKLLNVVKRYKFSSNDLNLHSIRFVGPNNVTIGNFKNSWILHRILESVLKDLGEGLDSLEDFNAAAEKEIARTNFVIFSKRQHYVKGLSTRAFNHYLQKIIPGESQRYRDTCTGVFFNCAQIPVVEDNAPLLSPIFKENLAETSPDNIRKLRERVENSLIK